MPSDMNRSMQYDAMTGAYIPSRGRLYKAGRSTHFTSGDHAGLQSVLLHHEIVQGKEVCVETYEHCVTNKDKWFSRPGDSGAFVFDKHGCVVGLLFAGAEGKCTSYFTHILDVFEDIKKVTGATSVRIMGSIVTF